MKNIILGGGLTALVARDLLGPTWDIIPIGRSRFFSMRPALDDNYVVRDPTIDDYMDKYSLVPILKKTIYSYGGQFTYNHAIALESYLEKLYGPDVPPHCEAFYKTRPDRFGYGDCIEMNQRLQLQFKETLVENNEKYGQVEKIEDHLITTSTGKKIEYDNIVNTIPLPALMKYMGLDYIDFKTKGLYAYHLRTKDLDFEGASHVLVADPEILFHKATKIDNTNYVFFSTVDIERPGQYFMDWMKNFELIAGTMIENAIACGPIPEVEELKNANITCIGKQAVWDDCLDIGSCIKRLINMANKGVIHAS